MSTENKKSQGELLSEKLTFTLGNCWEKVTQRERAKLFTFAEEYKAFIHEARTPYLFVDKCVSMLHKCGFLDVKQFYTSDKAAKPGDGVYQTVKEKSLFIAVMGKQPLSYGVNIICAHCDSPHVGLKTNPLYENSDLSFFDTYYYGGIKYYQWAAIPLAMHGNFFDADGTRRQISLGNGSDEPVFTITDLLPHLAEDQMKKTASDFIDAESIDILVGSQPYADKKISDRVKLNVLRILNDKYGMTEKSFANADISFVPAFHAKNVGFDGSMIGAYGHDDKSCAFAALQAALSFAGSSEPGNNGDTIPEKTIMCLFLDKEEVGGYYPYIRQFKYFLQSLCSSGIDPYWVLSVSSIISADVNAAFDPNYADVYDARTAPHLGKGIAISKYGTGNFAEMDFCQEIQNIFDREKIQWQYGGWGKPGKGGAGTMAHAFAEYAMNTLDCGIPVLSMHSPFEVISKVDLWTAYRAYKAFFAYCGATVQS